MAPAPLDEVAKAARQCGEALRAAIDTMARLPWPHIEAAMAAVRLLPIDKMAEAVRRFDETLRSVDIKAAVAWQKYYAGERERVLNEVSRRHGGQRGDDLAFALVIEQRRWQNRPLSELFPKLGARPRKSDVEAFIAVKDLLSRKDLSDYSACRLVARDLGLPLRPFYKRWLRAKQRA